MTDPFAIQSLALFALIVAAAGLVHGTLGMGFPVVATPLLALFLDVRTAIVLTLLPTVVVNVASILRGGNWSDSIGRFWPLAVYAVIGSVAGSHLLVSLDPAPFKLVLAALVLMYLAAATRAGFGLGVVKRYPRAATLAFGLTAGLAAGTTNVMVPVLIVFSLEIGLQRNAMVQVFNLCFLAGKLSQIAVFTSAGLVTTTVLLATAPLAATALLALLIGMRLRDRIPTQLYRRIVRGVLLMLALLLIAQYLLVDP